LVRVRTCFLDLGGLSAFQAKREEVDMDSRKPLTVKEVADYLQIAYTTVYRMAERRRLPAYKIGGHWRFDFGTIWDLSFSRQQITSDKGAQK
jgi:excisionase family DNA binding protein